MRGAISTCNHCASSHLLRFHRRDESLSRSEKRRAVFNNDNNNDVYPKERTAWSINTVQQCKISLVDYRARQRSLLRAPHTPKLARKEEESAPSQDLFVGAWTRKAFEGEGPLSSHLATCVDEGPSKGGFQAAKLSSRRHARGKTYPLTERASSVSRRDLILRSAGIATASTMPSAPRLARSMRETRIYVADSGSNNGDS